MSISFTGTGDHVNQATTLPPAMYTDPGVFDLEVERLFRHEWLAVARANRLPDAGDYQVFDLCGDPVVLVRGLDGQLRALSNVCLHRGCPLVEGSGNTGRRMTCPYHRWAYTLDGHLGAAPLMDQAEDFSPDALRLPQLRVEQWQGFVMVSAAADAPPLAPRLANLDALLDPFGLADWQIVASMDWDSRWNWKIMVENFLESYHHMGPHRGTLAPLYPAAGTHAVPLPGHFALLENPPASDDGHPFWVMCVYPNMLLALIRGPRPTLFWYQLQINTHDQFDLTTHVLVPPALAADADWCAAQAEQLRAIHLEDIDVCKGVWRGMHSRYARAGRLSHLEQCIWYFHDYLRNALER